DSDGLGDACFLPAYLRPLRIVLREVTPPSQGEATAPTDPDLNMIVTDPAGFKIGADSLGVIVNTIGDSASYSQIDGEDSVEIRDPKTGDYEIVIVPEANSNQSGRAYIIGIRTDGTVEEVLGPFTSPLSGETDTVFYQTIPYLWGDCDASRSVNIADVTAMIARIFSGGPACAPPESGDADCTGSFNIADVTSLIAYIFSGGAAPGCG
ncbi:MAG TPA: hypothetical protein VLB27_11815, partial [candidate division Zixibacteria bacterium]|nr:hypothetical protein [candidate division Zixibacteria bacterium]